MPIYHVRLNGQVYNIPGPPGATDEQVIAEAQRQLAALNPPDDTPQPTEAPKDDSLTGSFKHGIESLVSQLRTAYGAATGDANEAAEAGLRRSQDIDARHPDQYGWDRLKQAYGDKGDLTAAAAELLHQIPHAIADQAANLGVMGAGALVGGAVGFPVGLAGPGAWVGSTLASALPQFGSDIERQAQEQQAAGQKTDVDTTKAGVAATGQGLLDTVSGRIMFGKGLVSKLTGVPLEKLEGKAAEAAAKLANERLGTTLAKGLGTGMLAEIPTEVAQQILERWQAGLSLTSPDALKEYGDTAYQVGLLGPLGIVGRISEKSHARSELSARDDARRQQVLADQAASREAAGAADTTETDGTGATTTPPTMPPGGPGTPPIEEPVIRARDRQHVNIPVDPNASTQEQQRQQQADLDVARTQDDVRMPFHQEPQGTLPGMEPAPVVRAQPQEDLQARHDELARQAHNLAGALEDNQAALTRVATSDAPDQMLDQLLHQRTQIQQALNDAQTQLDAIKQQLPKAGSDEIAPLYAALQKAQADRKAELAKGDMLDPAVVAKLRKKELLLTEQLKERGWNGQPVVQQGLDMGKPVNKQSSESYDLFGNRVLGPEIADAWQDAYNKRMAVTSEANALQRIGANEDQTGDYREARAARQNTLDNDKVVADMGAKPMNTGVTEQGLLFGEQTPESKTVSGQSELGLDSEQRLISQLRIARAAGDREAVSEIAQRLRAKRTLAAQNRGQISDVDRKAQAARDVRDQSYAKMVELLEKYNKGAAKSGELEGAQQNVIDNLIHEIDAVNGEPLSDEQRKEISRQAYMLTRDLIERFGDTRNLMRTGEDEYRPAQYFNGQFDTRLGGEGTGPHGHGLHNVESKAPGRQTFGARFAASESIREGLDELRNKFPKTREQHTERTYAKAATPESVSKQLATSKAPLAQRIADNLKPLANQAGALDAAAAYLHNARIGKTDEALNKELEGHLRTVEEGKRSDEKQNELFEGTSEKGTAFNTTAQFQNWLASDALDTMRKAQGASHQTATRVARAVEGTKRRIAAITKQIERYQNLLRETQASDREENAAASMVGELRGRIAQLEKYAASELTDRELALQEALKAHQFTTNTITEIVRRIEANQEFLEGDFYKAFDRMARLQERYDDLLKNFNPTPQNYTEQFDKKYVELQTLKVRLNDSIKELLRAQDKSPSAAKIRAFLANDLRYQMELDSELDEVKRSLHDIAAAHFDLEMGKAEQANERAKLEGDLKIAEDLEKQASATRQNREAGVKEALRTSEAERSELQAKVDEAERPVNEARDARLEKPAGETLGERAQKSNEAAAAEQAARERVADSHGRTLITFEGRRALENADDRTPVKRALLERAAEGKATLAELDPNYAKQVQTIQARVDKETAAVAHHEANAAKATDPRLKARHTALENNARERLTAAQHELTRALDQPITDAQRAWAALKLAEMEQGMQSKRESRSAHAEKYSQQLAAAKAKRAALEAKGKDTTGIDKRIAAIEAQITKRVHGVEKTAIPTREEARAEQERLLNQTTRDNATAVPEKAPTPHTAAPVVRKIGTGQGKVTQAPAAPERGRSLAVPKTAQEKLLKSLNQQRGELQAKQDELEALESKRSAAQMELDDAREADDKPRFQAALRSLAEATRAANEATKAAPKEGYQAQIDALSDRIDRIESNIQHAPDTNPEKIGKTAKEIKGRAIHIGQSGPDARGTRSVSRVIEDATEDDLYHTAVAAAQGPALKNTVTEGQSAAEAMGDIASTSPDPLNRAIAERLKWLLGKTEVHLVDDLRNDDGEPAFGSAKVDGSSISLDSKTGLNEQTVLHEGIHAAIERALRLPDAALTEDQRAAKRELQELYQAYKDAKDTPTNENARENLSEFVSEAMTDAPVREYLRSKPWTLKNMWNAVKNGILSMLGVKTPSNMLEATLAAADRLMMRVERPTAKNTESLFRPRPAYAAGFDDIAPTVSHMVARERSTWEKVHANASGLAFETQFVDRFAPVVKALGKSMRDSLDAVQAMFYNRMYDQRFHYVGQVASVGALTRAEHTRADGRIEYTIEAKPGANLRRVMELLRPANSIVGSADATTDLFTAYLASLRAANKGYHTLNLGGSGPTAAELRAVKDKVEGNAKLKGIFDAARQEYNQFNRDQIDFLVQSGVIDNKHAADLVKQDDYIPFYRADSAGNVQLLIGDENPLKIGNLKDKPYLKEMLGGDEPIMNITTSALQNANMIVEMGLHNLATKSTVYALRDIGMAKVLKGDAAGPDIVQYWEHGKQKSARIDTDAAGVPAELLVKGMNGIPTQATGLLKFFGMPAKVLRKTVTATPMYAMRQLFRDSLAAVVGTGANFTPVLGALKEINSSTKGLLERRGIVGGQIFTGTQEDMAGILRRVAKGGGGGIYTAISKAEQLTMEADALTRRAQYNSYRSQGLSEMEATLAALEAMNFTKRGVSPTVHWLNTLVPFFNSQIQGLNVLYKAISGNMPFNDKLRIREKLITRGMLLMAASLAYAAAKQDDDDYKNATPDQKYGNWFVHIPGMKESLRIPVPFEIGYIFKSLPEALYNIWRNDDKGGEAVRAFNQILINTVPGGSSMPSLPIGQDGNLRLPLPAPMPAAVKPMVESALNASFYTGRSLLHADEEKLQPWAQYRPGQTSELAKMLAQSDVGKALGVSPVKFENTVLGYFSTLGLATLQLGSLAVPKGESPEQATKRLSQTPLLGAMFQDPDATGAISDVYNRMEHYARVKSTIDTLVKRGETAEAMKMLHDSASDYAHAELANAFTQNMAQLNQAEKAINAMPKMTPDEKRKALDQVRAVKIKLAEYAQRADRTTRQLGRP